MHSCFQLPASIELSENNNRFLSMNNTRNTVTVLERERDDVILLSTSLTVLLEATCIFILSDLDTTRH